MSGRRSPLPMFPDPRDQLSSRRSSHPREVSKHFFRVRIWRQNYCGSEQTRASAGRGHAPPPRFSLALFWFPTEQVLLACVSCRRRGQAPIRLLIGRLLCEDSERLRFCKRVWSAPLVAAVVAFIQSTVQRSRHRRALPGTACLCAPGKLPCLCCQGESAAWAGRSCHRGEHVVDRSTS